MTAGGNQFDRGQVLSMARALADLIDDARQDLSSGPPSAVLQQLSDHLGSDAKAASIVSHHWQSWEQASVNRGVQAHLARSSPDARWLGLPGGPMRMHNDLASLLLMDRSNRVGSADFVLLPVSPTATEEVVSFGLICTVDNSGIPVVLALREVQMMGPPQIAVEVLAADRTVASGLLAQVKELIAEHDVLRGQVLSFGVNEHQGNQLVNFLPRPEVPAKDVILPPDVLPAIEKHVAGPAEQATRLRDLGIHLKRGLLLHGPPGTGKTHTVRYLLGRLAGSTVVVLTGQGLMFIEQAAALARKLAPSLVVVEDVDLIAQDRGFSPLGNPALFSLLDAMDGVAADADVTFILTTNRVEVLEEALTQRPGRIDLAVEIPRPDLAGRHRLIELYRGRAQVAADLEPVIAATDGATASAIKEIMRRAVLRALEADAAADPPVVDDAILTAVVAEFTAEADSLGRALLGSGDSTGFQQPGGGGFGPAPFPMGGGDFPMGPGGPSCR
ncbi:MAG: AAA family ATPase [Nakamurella sp.]